MFRSVSPLTEHNGRLAKSVRKLVGSRYHCAKIPTTARFHLLIASLGLFFFGRVALTSAFAAPLVLANAK